MDRHRNRRNVATQHDWSGGDSLYISVVLAVANAIDRNPETLTPLASIFDPDALEDLVGSARDRPLRVQFEYETCEVAVTGSGAITVLPTEDVGGD